MPDIANICVYCGSSDGVDAKFSDAAVALGKYMVRAGAGLVYGGGSHGLMGAIAKTVIDEGGRVTGIIPDFLSARERKFEQASELIVVPDMHTRKRMMFEKADAFVALPGGIGTLEELVEQLTWVQLERHDKPVVLADVDGFWRPLLDLLAHMRNNGFIRSDLEVSYMVAERIEDVMPMIKAKVARSASKKQVRHAHDPRL